jgi:hypothetical protein
MYIHTYRPPAGPWGEKIDMTLTCARRGLSNQTAVALIVVCVAYAAVGILLAFFFSLPQVLTL